MRVVIDGTEYVPAAPAVGVAITTHNRPEVLALTLEALRTHSPEVPVIVVDDGSQTPATVPPGVRLIRHDTPQGIPAAKNRCIAELMAMGVEHLFLFDNDTRPVTPGWYQPYVDSAEPHLQHCWTHSGDGKPVPRMKTVYADPNLVAYGWSMGCMLYVTAEVVARVGGMRWEFGRGMEEHAEWSQRIHNAGFTTFVHQDVPDSEQLIWAADRYGAVPRSLPPEDRAALLARNEKLRLSLIDNDSFVPYTCRDIILTAYFTTQDDPQRKKGQRLADDGAALGPLRASVDGHELVVLSDSLARAVRVPVTRCAYEQRWISYRQYLTAHPNIRYVWLVDATDVVLLNTPFPHMRAGVLYCGWEPEVVGCQWIRDHSPNHGEWVEAHAQQMLFNCGVVGGDRQTILKLCQSMIDLWAAGDQSDPLEEMTLFNIAARRHREVVTGIQVTTVFKTNTRAHDTAWFAHK